jgi:hypothetical protein
MTIRAIISRLLGQQPMLLHKEGTVIGYYSGGAMTVLAVLKRNAFEISVIGPGKRETNNHENKGHGQQDDFQCLIIYHGLPS